MRSTTFWPEPSAGNWVSRRHRGKLGAPPDGSARIEKLREAEALLIEWANALQGLDKTPEDRKTEAIQRVVDLYEAWHTAEPDQACDAKAVVWRAKLPPQASDSGGDD